MLKILFLFCLNPVVIKRKSIKADSKEQSESFQKKHHMDNIIRCNQELIRGHFSTAAEMIRSG
jgi:hypothetical protein